jgi:hypothetical protein
MKWEMVQGTDGNNILDMHWEQKNRGDGPGWVTRMLRDLQEAKVA